MKQVKEYKKISSSLMNLLNKVDKMNDFTVTAFNVTDKSGQKRNIECSFTLLDENGHPVGDPIPSGSFAGIKIPTMHIPPVEVFELEYGTEYIEGFTIDGHFYTREDADRELGGWGKNNDNLQSEDLYGAPA